VRFLIILNDPPYGTERSYNGLRLAGNLVTKHEQAEVDVFLMGDAVSCAKSGQTTPNGYYNLERMLKPVLRGGRVLILDRDRARGAEVAKSIGGAALWHPPSATCSPRSSPSSASASPRASVSSARTKHGAATTSSSP